MATGTKPPPELAARTPKIKLQPPRRPAAYVWRPRLERVLDSAGERRLTTVVAGPGFGKSTLVAARALEHEWSWYSADSTDAALGVFARGLRDALGVAAIPEEALRADADGLAASFGQALDAALESDLVLVIDDVHELGGDTDSARFLEGLSRQAPVELHLVLCSREEVPFPTERLHGQGQAVLIDSSALAFTAEEVEVLLLDVSPDLSAAAEDLQNATGGWPAAVQLGAQMLATAPGSSPGQPLSALERRGGPLFRYLAGEVFGRESREVIELLRTVAPFERFSPELCAALGLPDPAVTLAHLQRRGLVVIGDETKSLRVHPLLRDFVLDTWPLSEAERRAIQRTAAAWSESKGLFAEALDSWREAGEPEQIVRVFCERRDELLEGGYVGAVVDAAESVPEELMDVHAKLLVTSCYGILGNKESELRYLRELEGGGAAFAPWVSFHLGNLYTVQGRYRDAITVLLSTDEQHAMNLAFVAYAYHSLGELEPSREYSMRALDCARETGHLTAEAEAHMNLGEVCIEEGDLAAAEHHLEIALETTRRARNVLAECSARTRVAMLRLAQGRYADALVAADECLALAERIGFAVFLAWALLVRGKVQYRLGRLDQAVADLALSAARYERLGGDSPRGWTLVRLATSHLERGDLTQARSAAETALAIGEQSENAGLPAHALAVLSRIVAGDPEHAAELAERAVALGGESDGEVLLARGWIALARDDHEAVSADASAVLTTARRLGRREWLAEALELQSWSWPDSRPLLEEALAIWRELGSPIPEARVELALAVSAGATADASRLRKKLSSLGVRDGAFRAAGPLMAIGDEDPSPVLIQTLGGFSVLRDGEQVPAAEWKSKKARDLLKVLVAARGRPLAREQLIEALWPGAPPERTGNRLSVALSTARAVLDPDRHFDAGHFIVGEEGAIRLLLDHLAVDVEAFLAEADAALRAWKDRTSDEARLLVAEAEESYGGDFLPEDRYEAWASPLRDEARGAYVEVARALADTSEGREAARYHLRILEGDPYDEQAHIGLVSAYERAGAHGEARRAYASYAARMGEIDVEPAALASLQTG